MKYTMLIMLVFCVVAAFVPNLQSYSGLDEEQKPEADRDSTMLYWDNSDNIRYEIGYNVFIGSSDLTFGDVVKLIGRTERLEARIDSLIGVPSSGFLTHKQKHKIDDIIKYYNLYEKIDRLEARIDTLEQKIAILELAIEYRIFIDSDPDFDYHKKHNMLLRDATDKYSPKLEVNE